MNLISTWLVEFKTGYELSDNDLARIKERIAEEIESLAEEYMANMSVQQSHFIPGPKSGVRPHKEYLAEDLARMKAIAERQRNGLY